jgi:heptosyltransferase III
MHQIVPKELLEKSNKILFIGGVAIGDFCYLHNYFKALHEQYPNLKIDLWHDEHRGKSCLLRWKSKKHDIVYEWLESCAFFNKIYKNVGAWWHLPKLFKRLRQEDYPIVVCLFDLRVVRTERFAKLISPQGFVVRAVDTSAFDSTINAFAYLFKKVFGVELSAEQRTLSFKIPDKWINITKSRIDEFGIKKDHKIIFLNSFAKDIKRCWDIEQVIGLINLLEHEKHFLNASFIINALPDKKEGILKIVKNNWLHRVHVFAAQKSFFELPAVISLCDLVISVDTSVVHLAYALNKPLVALMRQKNAYIFPKTLKTCAVFTHNRSDWIKKIEAAVVCNSVLNNIHRIGYVE